MDPFPLPLAEAVRARPSGLLVVPVYKPAREWEVFFPALVQAVAESGLPLVVRVVGDGNGEAGRRRIDDAVAAVRLRHPGVLRPTRHRDGNVGKGAAIYFGWGGAEEDWLGFVDSDGAIAPEEVIRLARIALLDTQQKVVVLGSRRATEGREVRRHWVRRLLARCFSVLVHGATGMAVADTQCGLKWVPRSEFLRIQPRLRESRFVFDVELLARLQRAGLALREEAISWSSASSSSLVLWRDGPAMLWGLLRVAARLRFGA